MSVSLPRLGSANPHQPTTKNWELNPTVPLVTICKSVVRNSQHPLQYQWPPTFKIPYARLAPTIALRRRTHQMQVSHSLAERQVPLSGESKAMTENVVRHTAERGAAHAKDAYRRTQEAAGETTKVMEQT